MAVPVKEYQLVVAINFGGHGSKGNLPNGSTAELTTVEHAPVITVTYQSDKYVIPLTNVAWFKL
jgi:hypothetical protein